MKRDPSYQVLYIHISFYVIKYRYCFVSLGRIAITWSSQVRSATVRCEVLNIICWII